jgi:NADPH-dependent ferric siderophore reductase
MAASPTPSGARPAQRRRPRPYQATVTGTEAITPHLLLAGDESAVPAIATLLEAVDPGLSVQVLIELEAADHQVPLPAHPGRQLRELSREPQDPPGTPLATAITAWTPPAGPGQVWTACEAAAVRTIRRHLLGPLARPAGRVRTRGYWRRGEENHPDHDYGDEPLS